MIRDIHNGHQSKEHFTNMIPINYHPDQNRVESNFYIKIAEMIDNDLDNRVDNLHSQTEQEGEESKNRETDESSDE